MNYHADFFYHELQIVVIFKPRKIRIRITTQIFTTNM